MSFHSANTLLKKENASSEGSEGRENKRYVLAAFNEPKINELERAKQLQREYYHEKRNNI